MVIQLYYTPHLKNGKYHNGRIFNTMGKRKKSKTKLSPRINSLELEDIVNSFLDGNSNPNWDEFENWFGKDILN